MRQEKRITIIYGKNETGGPTGKSFLANQLSLMYNNVVFIPARHSYFLEDPFVFEEVNEDTDLIILDDMKSKHISSAIQQFFPETMTVKRQGRKELIVKTPKVIITSDIDEVSGLGISVILRCNFIKTRIDYRGKDKVFMAKKMG